MAFGNFATLVGKGMSADRAYVDQMRRTVEAEFNQAIDAKFAALNIQEPGTPVTDPAILARLSAVEQALQGIGSGLSDLTKFEADTTSEHVTVETRLEAIEKALSDTQDVLAQAADHTADIPATPPASSGPATDATSGQAVAPAQASADGSVAAAGADPVAGGSTSVSSTGTSPAFAPVAGGVATTVPPTEIAPGTGQFVDPHATNPAAVATGAPAPVSGSSGQPGGDTTAVLPDSAPNASEAGRTAPQPTAANVASSQPFDPIAARANPAPFANTEQDAPKAPVINATASGSASTPDAAPVSANTSAPGTVGQATPNDPAAAS